MAKIFNYGIRIFVVCLMLLAAGPVISVYAADTTATSSEFQVSDDDGGAESTSNWD